MIGSLHTLSSVMMHEGDASFLVGHLLLVSIVSPFFFFFFFWEGWIFITQAQR